MSPAPIMGVQTLIIHGETGELSRLVIRRDGSTIEPKLRRLICPYAQGRPCSLNCAVIGASVDHDDVTLLWCRGSGNRVILGAPDPERTDLDEMQSMLSASAFAEQQQTRENQ